MTRQAVVGAAATLYAAALGGPREAANLPLDLLLGDSVGREPPKVEACGLNSNGMPLQLCVSARRGGTAMVLIGDPCADQEDSRVRQRESVACVWRLLAHTGCEGLRSALRAHVGNDAAGVVCRKRRPT